MCIINLIDSAKSGDWIKCLPAYQQKAINEWYDISGDYNIVADNWQKTTYEMYAPCGNTPTSKKLYFEQVLCEIEDLLRGNDKYKDLLKEINSIKVISYTALSTLIANSIADKIGSASVFIAPLIMLALETITQIGVKAWLNMRAKQGKENV